MCGLIYFQRLSTYTTFIVCSPIFSGEHTMTHTKQNTHTINAVAGRVRVAVAVVVPAEVLRRLTFDVLVVAGLLEHLGGVHDEVQERLGPLAEEVEQVAVAAVLGDHQHRSW